jgi:hypothetical protein
MYVVSVVLFMLVLPLVSIAVELSMGSHVGGTVFVVGRWFVFWGAGGAVVYCGGSAGGAAFIYGGVVGD